MSERPEMIGRLLGPEATFVPATIASLKSTDARELGVRVFRAYVQPR